jgi:hypothetical protein
VINSLKRRCDTKNPEIFPPSVFTCSCDSHNNPVYSSTALRDHSFSWKHIVLSLEARSNSLCARYEEITFFFFFCGSSCSIPDHPCWICVGYSGIETGCSSSTVVYPFIIILIMFHTHLHLNTIPMRMRSGRSLGIFK